MKKVVAFILSIVYLTSSVGATVHLHYCMDKLVNWSLNDAGSKCENCGMEKNDGCCKDEQKLIKNNTDQKITQSTIQVSQISAVIATIPAIYYIFELNSTLRERHSTHRGPPNLSGFDILIYNCVFRI